MPPISSPSVMQLHQAVFLSAGGMALVMLGVLALLLPMRSAGIKEWFLANASALLAYAFFAVGWDDSWRPGVELANFLYACTATLVATGFQKCAGLRARYGVLLCASALMVAVLAYFHYVEDLLHFRIIAVSVFHFLPAYFVLDAIRKIPGSDYVTRPLRLAKLLTLLVVLTLVARIVSRIPYLLAAGAGTAPEVNGLAIVLLCLGTLLLPGLTLAGAAVSTSRLLHSAALEARTDPLTGLWTRRAFMGFVERELERSSRLGFPLTLLVIDIDDFKRINDSYGHATGDRVLVRVAQLCMASVRSIDYVCRLGGEEFVVLLADTDADQAMVVAERIRHALAAPATDSVPFTVSAGIAQYARGDTWARLFEAADSALYRAKARGKNCCVVAQAPGAQSPSPSPPVAQRLVSGQQRVHGGEEL